MTEPCKVDVKRAKSSIEVTIRPIELTVDAEVSVDSIAVLVLDVRVDASRQDEL